MRQNSDSFKNYSFREEKLQIRHLMISGLDSPYHRYTQMKQPITYRDASHALLLKESINPPCDDMLVMKDVLATVQSIKDVQDQSN